MDGMNFQKAVEILEALSSDKKHEANECSYSGAQAMWETLSKVQA